jgi:hypothetical protein
LVEIFLSTPRIVKRAFFGFFLFILGLGTVSLYGGVTRKTNKRLMPCRGITPHNLIQTAIPFGAGVRFKLSDSVNASAERAFRYLFAVYIDDVSRSYADPGAPDSELARALSDRGNALGVDVPRYTVTVTYGLNNRLWAGEFVKQPGIGQT